jgi:DNA-binding response OmpR family regulator
MRLLVVEDDKKVAQFIARGFEQEHHAVDVAYDGQHGAELALRVDYDVIILDVMLPKLSGLQFLEIVKKSKPNVPVLILSANGEVEDRIKGLDHGADDYMVKPFAFAEISARVRALSRRGNNVVTTKLSLGDLVLDTTKRMVTRAGRKLDLSSKEFALLELLLRNANRPVTRTMIIEHVWDIHFNCVTNVVDVYIKYLRNKVDAGFSPPLIRTIRGVGYMATDDVE